VLAQVERLVALLHNGQDVSGEAPAAGGGSEGPAAVHFGSLDAVSSISNGSERGGVRMPAVEEGDQGAHAPLTCPPPAVCCRSR
jgi:hypothetical protein